MAQNLCPKCGAELGETVEGTCVACLLQVGLEVDPASLIQEKLKYFGDYELMEVVGRGGMGMVFRAWQISRKREVALKMISSGELASPEMVRRFRREATATALLAHPNIVEIHEVGEHEGHQFIAMRLIRGQNLAVRLPSLRGNPRQGCEIVTRIARAVHFAHQHGVLHRDLKPANILIDGESNPYLTDFGLARIIGEDWTQSNVLMGTPPYMSPEQLAQGPRYLTTLSEVYSLGVILYEVLAGRLPYEGRTPHELLVKVEQHDLTPLRGIAPEAPRALENICTKALKRDPASRYRTVEEFAQDLDRWLRGEQVMARTELPWERVWHWTCRNPMATALLSTLLIALTVAMILLATLRQKTDRVAHLVGAARNQIEADLDKLWADTNQTSQPITSETLSILAGLQDSALSGVPHYRVGVYENKGKAITMVENFAPLLNYLEQAIVRQGGPTARFDLVLLKYNEDARQAFAGGGLDFGRFGANPYWLLKQTNPAVVLVGKENKPHAGVIFVRKDSPIKDLSGLRGAKIAVGEETSTVSGTYAPVFLLEHGIRAVEFKEFKWHHNSNDVFEEVASGRYDAGIRGMDSFAIQQFPNLVILTNFRVLQPVWAGRRGLDRTLLESFERALLACPREIVRKLMPDAAERPFVKTFGREYESQDVDRSHAMEFFKDAPAGQE